MTNNTCKPCGGKVNECVLDESGVDTNTGCMIMPDGITVCPDNDPCTLWDLTQNSDACLITDYIEENINIGGAQLNVHKLLGVHEQGSLTDLSGVVLR